MKIIITNKAAYVIIFFLLFLLIGMGVNARVDLSKAYHTLQNIVQSNDPTLSVDGNADGIIDEADEALEINWYDINNFQKCDGVGINGEEEFVTGFSDTGIICNPLGLICASLNISDCYIQIGRGVNEVITELSVVQNFNPEHVIKDGNFLWLTLVPEDPNFNGGLAVKLECSDSACSSISTTSIYNIPSPRQIDIHNGEIYVGTDLGKFYKISTSGCLAVTTNFAGEALAKPKGIVANNQGVFVLDEVKNQLNKYALNLKPLTQLTISSPQYLTEGSFGGKTKIIVVSNAISASYIKVYDAETLQIEANLLISEDLSGIAFDNVEKLLFLPRSQDILRYSLNYDIGTEEYTLSDETTLNILHSGIKTLYAHDSKLYLPLNSDGNVSIYDGANTAQPTLLKDITSADLSGTMQTCEDTTLCGPMALLGHLYPPLTNSEIGESVTTTFQSWTYVTGTPGDCQFTCTNGSPYNALTNVCGYIWNEINTGTNYDCNASSDTVTYEFMQEGDSCDTEDDEKYYCYNCDPDHTSCEYDKFQCTS